MAGADSWAPGAAAAVGRSHREACVAENHSNALHSDPLKNAQHAEQLLLRRAMGVANKCRTNAHRINFRLTGRGKEEA